MIIITIGVGIICLGVGLFIGKAIAPTTNTTVGNEQQQPNIIQRWIAGIKEKKRIQAEEDAARNKAMQEARIQAIKSMGPELIEKMKEEEMKKVTGEDKKDKLKKLADAFSMQGTGIGSTEKINQMLGQQPEQPVQQQPENHMWNEPYFDPAQQPRQRRARPQHPQPKKKSPFDMDDKLARMLR